MRKKVISMLLILAVTLAGCGKDSSTTNAAIDGDLKLADNQTLLIAQVSTINGNEITLALAEEVDLSSMQGGRGNRESTSGSESISENSSSNTSEGADTAQNSEGSTSQEDRQMPNGGIPNSDSSVNGEMSSGGMPSGQMPSGEMPSGNMPDGFPGQDTDSSSDSSSSKGGKSSSSNTEDSSKQSRVMYTLTGEEKTMLIPVGTPVTTLLGTVSTFSRIAIDNTLKVVVETNEAGEEVIVAIYIVG
ncbi:hypothetical protein [Anaerosporobacter sp.]|uniref:hypothetical protein n=1 Tax=Anaerosporobacter sp. TaxID=1872529 RepID=UPI00286EC360|nr:hypothetical protein [Anaerosporobacter sp.]